jgi:hypothetical protein
MRRHWAVCPLRPQRRGWVQTLSHTATCATRIATRLEEEALRADAVLCDTLTAGWLQWASTLLPQVLADAEASHLQPQVPNAKRHDHLPGAKGYFNATGLQAGAGPLWVCEGAFDALALLAGGVPRVVAIFGVQGWRWDWAREVRALVFALDADSAGQQQRRQLARQATLRGKQVAVLEPAAYGGHKDVSEAWVAGVLRIDVGPAAAATESEGLAILPHLREPWAERVAIMVADGGLPHADAEHLAWAGLQTPGAAP